ncbi:MAG TPA: hypothetical protein PKC24_04510 [Cyclobacteriaceae bacterium]|nr:hypothetical protein [Cyclobacteriaceae bacterium]
MFNTAILYLHILAGILALVVAPAAIVLAQKNIQQHKRWGLIFFWSMTLIFVSAVYLSLLRFNPFLLMVAFFSYYSIFSAYRFTKMKAVWQKQGIRFYDWLALIVAFVFNLSFLGLGAYHAYSGKWGVFAYLAMGFAIGGLLTVRSHFKVFRNGSEQRFHWLFAHMGNMLGGFIAAVTAFSSQVMHFMPGALAWAWPSIVGVPLIFWFIGKYRRRVANGEAIFVRHN